MDPAGYFLLNVLRCDPAFLAVGSAYIIHTVLRSQDGHGRTAGNGAVYGSCIGIGRGMQVQACAAGRHGAGAIALGLSRVLLSGSLLLSGLLLGYSLLLGSLLSGLAVGFFV